MSGVSLLAAIPPPPGNGFEIGPLDIRFYGLLIATGVLIAITMTRRRYAALGGDPDLADRIAFRVVLLGFVGARIAYVLPRLDDFADRPLAVFAIWEGGIALFGGLTAAVLTGVWFLRRRQGDLPAFADAVAPAIPIAQAIGRWGNYFNQELYGTPTDLPWALQVDEGRRVAPYQDFATFHPTFLYESLWNLSLAGFLIWLDRRGILPRGALLFVYFIGYAVARFALELLRTDTTFRFLGLSRNGWFSLAVVAGAIIGLIVWTRRLGGTTDADESSARNESEASTDSAEPAP
ncbi:MAG: prolipoprotein diacylglyceryl transferase [Nitriliruptorales bacterium]|nr:prolipoprotein diacylglyceryl transferase [Nitriliruptorales bacterium]